MRARPPPSDRQAQLWVAPCPLAAGSLTLSVKWAGGCGYASERDDARTSGSKHAKPQEGTWPRKPRRLSVCVHYCAGNVNGRLSRKETPTKQP